MSSLKELLIMFLEKKIYTFKSKLNKSKDSIFLETFVEKFPEKAKKIKKLMIENYIVESSEGLVFPKLVIHADADSSEKYPAIHTGKKLLKLDTEGLYEYLDRNSQGKYKDLNESYKKAINLENIFNNLLDK